MTKTFMALAAAACMVSAHAGGMDHKAAAAVDNPGYGATEAASQTHGTAAVRAPKTSATAVSDAGTMADGKADTKVMGAQAAAAPSDTSRMGAPEVASQSRASRW